MDKKMFILVAMVLISCATVPTTKPRDASCEGQFGLILPAGWENLDKFEKEELPYWFLDNKSSLKGFNILLINKYRNNILAVRYDCSNRRFTKKEMEEIKDRFDIDLAKDAKNLKDKGYLFSYSVPQDFVKTCADSNTASCSMVIKHRRQDGITEMLNSAYLEGMGKTPYYSVDKNGKINYPADIYQFSYVKNFAQNSGIFIARLLCDSEKKMTFHDVFLPLIKSVCE